MSQNILPLTKNDFILPKFRKRSKSPVFDFLSFKIDDPSVLKKIKEIIEPNRDELTIAEKEIDHKKE